MQGQADLEITKQICITGNTCALPKDFGRNELYVIQASLHK